MDLADLIQQASACYLLHDSSRNGTRRRAKQIGMRRAGLYTTQHAEKKGVISQPFGRICAMKLWGLGAGILTACMLKAACIPVALDEAATVTASTRAPGCFNFAVELGEVAQISVDQRADLALRIVGAGREWVVDGFDFGPETATLVGAASYDVYVSRVEPDDNSTFVVVASRRGIPVPLADSWQKAEALASQSKSSQDEADISESLLAWQELGQVSAVVRTLLKMGSVELRASSEEARDIFEKALDTCRSISDLRCAAEAANNSGLASLRLGELDEASRRLLEAAADWRSASYPVFEGRTLSNIGFLLTVTGDYQRAIDVYSQAEPLLESRDPVSHARLINNIALCYQYLAEFERAAGLFETALARFVANDRPHEALRARLNLGRTHMLQGRLERAQRLLEQSLAEAVEHSDASGRADVLNNLGQVLLRRSQPDEARQRLTEALEAQRALRSRRGEAIALHHLGLEARQRMDLRSARRFLEEALRIREETGLRDDASESALALAEVAYAAGDRNAARDLAEKAVGSIEVLRNDVSTPALRASFYARKRAFFDLLVDIAVSDDTKDAPASGLLAAEKGRGRALLDIVVQGAQAPVPKDLLDQRRSLERQASFLANRLSSASSEWELDLRDRLRSMLNDAGQLDTEITRAFESQDLGRPLRSVQELQSGLPPDSALLEYHLGERTSYLWLVTREQVKVFHLPPRGSIEPVASRTAALFAAIGERLESAQRLAEFEWGVNRLSAVLLGSLQGVSLPPRIVLVLDGVLNRVPMTALRLPQGGAIGLSHEIVQAPSAAYLLAGRLPHAISDYRRGVVAVADPVYSSEDPRVVVENPPVTPTGDPELPRLPFIDDLRMMSSLLPPSRFLSLTGFNATPAVLHKSQIGDFGILHFSTHTVIDEHTPEQSRVILSLVDSTGHAVDGFLRPRQFAELSLNGSTVVLSSCETALGKMVIGEGLRGFTHSLFQAGASQLVLSLAKTDAVASAQFFSEFYRRALAQGDTVERALTMARRRLSADPRWSDPFYWAVYTVIGRPSPAAATALPPL